MNATALRHACIFRHAAPICFALSLLASKQGFAQTYTLTTLATFNNTNGASPQAGVTLDAGGNLYGTTTGGGNLTLNSGVGDGTLFKIAAGTNALTTVVTFNGTNGNFPAAAVTLDASGNLYGTTKYGSSGNGSVFKIDTGTLTTLANFNGTNGQFPYGSVTLDSNGNLYGTAAYGGASNGGTVFKIAAGTNTITTLATFTGTANGTNPDGSVALDSSGNLYGTTQYGGANNDGTVFKIAAGTNTLTTLATFNGTNGAGPYAGVTLDANGNLYGTTTGGGASGYGTVFKIAAGTNSLTTLANFNRTNGNSPYGGVTLDSSGNLYGTAAGGGDLSVNNGGGYGTVFKIVAGTNTLTTLATFHGANGATPYAGVTLDANGNLYGTTSNGGNLSLHSGNGYGTVFELSPTSASTPEPGALILLLPALPLLAGGLYRRCRAAAL